MTHGGRLFEIARARDWDWRDMLDFSASINPLGPSPAVLEAIRAAANEIVHYPESHPRQLVSALAYAWSVSADKILLGNGATDLIHFLGAVFRDQPATLCVPVFSEFHRVFPNAHMVGLNQPALWPSTGVTVVTRPANPTGELVSFDNWLARTTHTVIVDESFIEFAEVPSLANLVDTRPNLLVLRSLTKFHGIPGLRVGALIAAPNTITSWRKLRDPWSVNVLAIRAACASLADTEHGRRTLEIVRAERAWLAAAMSSLPGVAVHPSSANYIFARLQFPAESLTTFLEDRKILIRDCTGWPGFDAGNGVRVAVRTRTENERLIASWKEFSCES